MFSGIIYEDVAHRVGHNAEEVLPVLPAELFSLEQPYIRFVDERGGL